MKYIAGLFFISAMFCFGAAAFSMPIGIGAWLYEWAVNDIELKLALWNAFVIWLKLVFGGLILGYIFILIAKFLDK